MTLICDACSEHCACITTIPFERDRTRRAIHRCCGKELNIKYQGCEKKKNFILAVSTAPPTIEKLTSSKQANVSPTRTGCENVFDMFHVLLLYFDIAAVH
jgi:hypothetical protein